VVLKLALFARLAEVLSVAKEAWITFARETSHRVGAGCMGVTDRLASRELALVNIGALTIFE
jgi:hypothetical protein